MAGYSLWGCKRVRHDLAAKQQLGSMLYKLALLLSGLYTSDQT